MSYPFPSALRGDSKTFFSRILRNPNPSEVITSIAFCLPDCPPGHGKVTHTCSFGNKCAMVWLVLELWHWLTCLQEILRVSV